MTTPRADTFDYIVVGAGSAGCAAASRLSEDARVLLVEGGGADTQAWIHSPDGIVQAVFADPAISRPYATEAQPHLGGRSVAIHRGTVRGGCSSINGLIYVRGNRRDYDGWAAAGCDGWSYEDVLPYFRRSERHEGGPSPYHGTSGPLSVRRPPSLSPAAQAWVAAAAALYPDSGRAWDFNGERQEDAAGFYDLTLTADGRRASAAVAFLDPARSRGTLTVRTDAQVTRVLIERGRARGVVVRSGGAEQTAFADAEVILAAGTFESPRLLMLSGIGPAAELAACGITCAVDLPGVGRNLHDHMQVITYWLTRVPSGRAHALAEAGLFTRTSAHTPHLGPDLQYHVLAGWPELLDPAVQPNLIVCPCVAQPVSRGEVRLRSADPGAALFIQPNYLEAIADVEVLVQGFELAREIAAQQPLAGMRTIDEPFALDPTEPGVRLPLPRDAAGLRQFVAAHATTVWHPVGTCRMGQDAAAVVDPQLRVRGVDGLRVADASVIPTITTGNTNAPAIMIGERVADFVMASARPAAPGVTGAIPLARSSR